MIIQHNIMALNSYNRLGTNNGLISKNLEKLSSGYKINRAGDDAAGLAISEKMRAQITGLTRATQNSQDGISLVQTAEGNLTEVHSMLNRMVDLATQSSNGTIDDAVDRKNLQKEVQSLKDEINRIADSSHFNGIKLLDGSLGGTAAVTTPGVGGVGGTATVSTLDFSKMKENFKEGSSITISTTDKTGAALTKTFTFKATAVAANGEVAIGATLNDTLTNLGTFMTTANGFGANVWATSGGATNNVLTMTSLAPNGAAEQAIGGLKIEGTKGIGLGLQIGDTANQRVSVSVGSMSTKALGLDPVDVSSEANASKAIDVIKNSINTVSSTRADLGAIQNRLEHTVNNLTTTTENMTAAESRIRDTDMAKEMMQFTKNNVLAQAAQSMLAQANQQPQQVLQLLR